VIEIPASFKRAKNKEEIRPVWLYEVYIWEEGKSIEDVTEEQLQNYRFAETNKDIEVAGKIWRAFPVVHEARKSELGRFEEIQVRLSNIDTSMFIPFIEDPKYNYLLGRVVKIYLAFPDESTTDIFGEKFFINQVSYNESEVFFRLVPIFNLLGFRLPARHYTSDWCLWIYKSEECGYTGPLPTCDKTLWGENGCVAHDNSSRFGGFPTLERISIYRL